MKMIIKLMPLFGQNPHRLGRNKDIDLTKIAGVEYPIHAVIRLKKQAIKIRDKAATCHASQGGARPRPGPFRILRIADKFRGLRDYFMRDYPPVHDNRRESDLFDGIA